MLVVTLVVFMFVLFEGAAAAVAAIGGVDTPDVYNPMFGLDPRATLIL
jgi:multisubunit Na+/H+ antiporter MnhG subunit